MVQGVEILGYTVLDKGLKGRKLFDDRRKYVINTINAYSYVLAEKDLEFKNALINSDVLLPDGFPIVWAAKVLNKQEISKVAGEDIFFHLMQLANQDAKKVFFLGSNQDTLKKIQIKICVEYPNIKVDSFSPPYNAEFSAEDSAEMIEAINTFNPHIVFVGMTAPKQEKWVEANKNKLHAEVICSIGAVFDFYAETVKRPSRFWIDLRLEWFIRLLHEPKRLWKRYLIYSPKFFIDVVKEKLGR